MGEEGLTEVTRVPRWRRSVAVAAVRVGRITLLRRMDTTMRGRKAPGPVRAGVRFSARQGTGVRQGTGRGAGPGAVGQSRNRRNSGGTAAVSQTPLALT